MLEIQSSTEIAAPASTVWSVLTEFRRYWAWNPFIRRARGKARAGEEVRVKVQPSFGGVRLGFRAKVLDSEENSQLHWRGHVIAPWIASGEHWFTIEPVDDQRVRFVQRERFTGLVPRLAAGLLAREVQRGFDAMNRALAMRAQEVSAT